MKDRRSTFRRACSFAVVALIGLLLVSTLEATPTEGCTPGYWKNHTDAWPAGYLPTQKVSLYFNNVFGPFVNVTLLEALNGGGGPGVDGAEQILLRAAVAALLNAASFGAAGGTPFVQPLYLRVVIVQPALATQNRDAMLAVATQLDGWNNLGCPF